MVMSLGNFGRITLAWAILCTAGVYSFVLSRNSVQQRRHKDMQIRERMRKANVGEYESIGDRKFSV